MPLGLTSRWLIQQGRCNMYFCPLQKNGARDVGSACFNAKFATARLASFKLWAVEVFAVVATRAQPRSRLTRTPRDEKGGWTRGQDYSVDDENYNKGAEAYIGTTCYSTASQHARKRESSR